MARKAVNYVFETPGGTIYHGADSHFSNYFAKHGKDFNIDVAINNYGDNPIGIQDKMTSIDLLRMAENLRAKVIIPVHYDIWSNFMASTDEILALWKMRIHSFGKSAVNTLIRKTKTELNTTIHVVLMIASSTIQIFNLRLYYKKLSGNYPYTLRYADNFHIMIV